MRVPYEQVFAVQSDGSVRPRAPVEVNGLRLGIGVPLSKGVPVAGTDLAAFAGRDLEVEFIGGAYVLRGIY